MTLRLFYLILFLVALSLLALGVNNLTAPTEKDEYLLSMRVPLCMQEEGHWLIPCLDENPRLKKPPMLYWITAVSYYILGPSLLSARLISVLFAATLVVLSGLIATRLSGDLRLGMTSGLISLSFIGTTIGGRILVLDLPVATFSALAYYLFLCWKDKERNFWLATSSLAFCAGFLLKGPVVAVLAGSGLTTLIILRKEFRVALWRHKVPLAIALVSTGLLSLSWFGIVLYNYPGQLDAELSAEMTARRFFDYSTAALTGILLWGLPWSFVIFGLLYQRRQLSGDASRSLMEAVLWLLLSLLPFMFFRSFERYAFGSMLPLSVATAHLIYLQDLHSLRFFTRAGMMIALLFVSGLASFIYWFNGPGIEFPFFMASLVAFSYFWWRGASLHAMAISSALLWTVVIGLVYPRLKVNDIPDRIIQTVSSGNIILHGGPQPALLPIVLGRSLHMGGDPASRAELVHDCSKPLYLFVQEEKRLQAEGLWSVPGLHLKKTDSYRVLSSRVSWLNMMREGATMEDFWLALKKQDLDPVKSEIHLYQIGRSQCSKG